MVLESNGNPARIRAAVDLKAVGDPVAVQHLVQPAGAGAKPILISNVDCDRAESAQIADVLVEVAAMPRGKKPYRRTADPSDVGGEEGAAVIDRFGAEFYRRLGLEHMLKVAA